MSVLYSSSSSYASERWLPTMPAEPVTRIMLPPCAVPLSTESAGISRFRARPPRSMGSADSLRGENRPGPAADPAGCASHTPSGRKSMTDALQAQSESCRRRFPESWTLLSQNDQFCQGVSPRPELSDPAVSLHEAAQILAVLVRVHGPRGPQDILRCNVAQLVRHFLGASHLPPR